jgi:curved DNA-binding protein CbpA
VIDEMSLYDVLKVKRDATLEEITRAYRELSKAFHPDRNAGDDAAAAQYQRVQDAFDVLSDSARRAEYDATGKARKANDARTRIASVIAPFLLRAIHEKHPFQVKASRRDLMTEIRNMLDARIESVEDHLANARRDESELAELVGRFEVSDDANCLDDIVVSQLRGIRVAIAQLLDDLDGLKAAYDFLKKAKFRRDDPSAALKSLSWGSAAC